MKIKKELIKSLKNVFYLWSIIVLLVFYLAIRTKFYMAILAIPMLFLLWTRLDMYASIPKKKKVKKKKKEFYKTEWFKTLLGVVICLIVFLIFYTSHQAKQFNPDEDVCNGVIYYKVQCGYKYNDDVTWESYTYDLDKSCGGISIQLKVTSYCDEDWRPKTICELNPNSENCICVEYEYKLPKKYDYVDYYNFDCFKYEEDIKSYNKYNDTLSETLIYMATIMQVSCEFYTTPQKGECIKSHLPNECEKGNEDYILEYINYTKGCNQYGCAFGITDKWGYEDATFNNKHLDNITTYLVTDGCRKKTIYDYSCEEILEGYKQHRGFYCKSHNGFDYHICFNPIIVKEVRPECFERKESEICNTLKDIAIEKGCDI